MVFLLLEGEDGWDGRSLIEAALTGAGVEIRPKEVVQPGEKLAVGHRESDGVTDLHPVRLFRRIPGTGNLPRFHAGQSVRSPVRRSRSRS
jgi:hypothetical protein